MILQGDNVFCVTMDGMSILSLSSTYRRHVLLQENNTPRTRKHKCLSGEELQECVGGRKRETKMSENQLKYNADTNKNLAKALQ